MNSYEQLTEEALPCRVDYGEVIAGASSYHQVKWSPVLDLKQTQTRHQCVTDLVKYKNQTAGGGKGENGSEYGLNHHLKRDQLLF